MEDNFDFGGWATKNGILCADGKTIMQNAFIKDDSKVVPLVWNHQHNDPTNILGHAVLENRPEGVYAYGTFNDTEAGQHAKEMVEHKDITSLSIFANKLQQKKGHVLHGVIREVSLVLAGANIGACIDTVLKHGEEIDDEAVIFMDEELALYHAANIEKDKINKTIKDDESDDDDKTLNNKKESTQMSTNKDATVAEVFDTLTEDQKTVVYAMIGEALQENLGEDAEDEGDEGANMKHNLFDGYDYEEEDYLSHADMADIFADAKRLGSLKESIIEHNVDDTLQHSITDIDYLFPEARTLSGTPDYIKRDDTWVKMVMNSTHHSPFSRIKSIIADITADEARAKGYLKGNLKKDEVFTLLKRSTNPTTIYKKQKLERDDVVDIVDLDVVAWLKSEMRMMLDEEIARAILIGDGRLTSSDDKISESNIRPVWKDAELYNIKANIKMVDDTIVSSSSSDKKAKAFIKTVIKSRKDYKGSGSPTLYTTEDVLTDCLLLEDTTGRVIYDTEEKLKTALRVSSIVTVPVMENCVREEEGIEYELLGLIVNLKDYNVGADKGGAINMFDDFDIDYNAQKYLIETRCSGALIKPFSSITLEVTKSDTAG